MNWMDQISGLLKQYGGGQAPTSGNVEEHFDQAAQAAPASALADGLAAAFRSKETPPFAQMASQLFGASSGSQQAGVLNTLLTSAGPGLLSSLLSGGGVPGLASILGGGATQLTPEQAAQVPPEEVQRLAEHVEKHDPSIVDQISGFYSEHPTLIKTLGGAALAIAMNKMFSGRSEG
jgi:hypothetical protein